MWEPIVVLLIVGLAISRIADPINEILSSVVPSRLAPTSLSGSRVVLWVVAAIFATIAVGTIDYDPIAAVGIADAGATGDVWNILFLVTITDAMDLFFRRRLVR